MKLVIVRFAGICCLAIAVAARAQTPWSFTPVSDEPSVAAAAFFQSESVVISDCEPEIENRDFVDGLVVLPVPVWAWQLLPDRILYSSYLAGVKEPRLGTSMLSDADWGTVWDHTIGARIGLLRFGTEDVDRPEGWQLDLEAATYLRQDIGNEMDIVGSDFRYGLPLTYARGPFHAKFAFYHMSAHLGDEFQLKNPMFMRRNYARDAVVLGLGYFLIDALRLYAEIGYAFNMEGGAEPLELQFGADFSPRRYNGRMGTPFFAINAHLREEFNFGGNLNLHTGWQWRSQRTGRILRAGFQYFNGKIPLYEFFNRHDELIGGGVWYDF